MMEGALRKYVLRVKLSLLLATAWLHTVGVRRLVPGSDSAAGVCGDANWLDALIASLPQGSHYSMFFIFHSTSSYKRIILLFFIPVNLHQLLIMCQMSSNGMSVTN